MHDDIDAFHRSKDKLSLQLSDDQPEDGAADSESDEEDAVFDLGGGDSSSEDTDGDGEGGEGNEDGADSSEDERETAARIAACEC